MSMGLRKLEESDNLCACFISPLYVNTLEQNTPVKMEESRGCFEAMDFQRRRAWTLLLSVQGDLRSPRLNSRVCSNLRWRQSLSCQSLGLFSGKFFICPLAAQVLEDLLILLDPRRAESNCVMSLTGEDCCWHHDQRDLVCSLWIHQLDAAPGGSTS